LCAIDDYKLHFKENNNNKIICRKLVGHIILLERVFSNLKLIWSLNSKCDFKTLLRCSDVTILYYIIYYNHRPGRKYTIYTLSGLTDTHRRPIKWYIILIYTIKQTNNDTIPLKHIFFFFLYKLSTLIIIIV